jgi:DNA-binding GntR family transcriptional regulator
MDQDNKARPLERRVFREEIREQLIEAILSGKLAPGARIVETRIAQQFGVSQGPVREALRDLELFGFVVSSPFRGTQVRKFSTEELLEIYPIRAALEGVAARSAAVRINKATLDRLEVLLGQMREAAVRDDHRGEADADHNFHHAIVKASGNGMLELRSRVASGSAGRTRRANSSAVTALRRSRKPPENWSYVCSCHSRR